MNRPDQLIVLQLSPYCNMDCSYCYLPDRSDRTVMTMETIRAVRAFIDGSSAIRDQVTVVLHASEPLATPFELVEACATELAQCDKQVRLSIQTNATLVSRRWIDLITRHDIHVGVSLDGPEEIHDRYRVFRNGRGTHSATVRGIRRLEAAGIKPSNICVVTPGSSGEAVELAQHFAEYEFSSVGFNVCEMEGTNTTVRFRPDDRRQIQHFFREFLLSWDRLGRPYPVRELHQLVPGLLSSSSGSVGQVSNSLVEPGEVVTITTAGAVSTFCPELAGQAAGKYGAFSFWNVHEAGGFDVALDNFREGMVAREVARGVERCRADCSYFALCGGGAPGNKYFEFGRFDVSETTHCALGKKALADGILEFAGAR